MRVVGLGSKPQETPQQRSAAGAAAASALANQAVRAVAPSPFVYKPCGAYNIWTVLGRCLVMSRGHGVAALLLRSSVDG